jgi:hypothetical protein
VASSIQQKADGMANSRAQLATDFNALTNELGSTQIRLADLEVKSAVTESNLTRLQTALSNRVDQLHREAEQAAAKAAKKAKKNKWRKTFKSVGNILAVSPIGTPIVNAIGSGMVLAADVRKPSDLVRDWGHVQKVAGAFKGGAFASSAQSFKDAVRPLNPAILHDTNGWSNYKLGIRALSKDLQAKVTTNQERLKPKEAAAKTVEDLLAFFKADAPELNQRIGDGLADGLMDQINGTVRELQQLNVETTDAMQQIAGLTGEIQRHILAVDAMNRDVSAQNAILDHRALVHLKEMDRRAKERLRKYQYYLAKSYEYRFLEPYPGELNLNAIFDRMVAIGQAGTSAGGLLSAADFQSLKAVYDDELAEVTFAVIERFQQNPPARRAPVSLALSGSELAALNAGQPVRLNMVESYLLLAGDEDMRINDIGLTNFDMAVSGPPEQNATISLRLVHSGFSKVRSGTNDFYFRHDQQQEVWPFQWETRYDLNTGQKTPIVPSPADVSLLQFLLSLRGVATTANLLLFSRPGMWADMELVRNETRALPNYAITNVIIQMSYDYRSKPNNLVALDVSVSDERVAPYIIVSTVDKRGRQDGVGRFYRTYQEGAGVTLTAPHAFGIWQFERWTDAFGRNLPGGLGASNVLTLTLNEDWAVQAKYFSTDSDEDGLPDDWERRFYPNLARGQDDDTDSDGWGCFAEFLNEASPLLWDTDGDGLSDGAEGIAGTDPTNAASALRLRQPVLEPGGIIRLEWASAVGKSYMIEATSGLGVGLWQTVTTVIATGSVTSARIAPDSPGFYRVKVADSSP